MSRSSGKLQLNKNVSGSQDAEFEVREDEEQNVKLGQTIDLLLAAGYFRVRIKGLSPFDKVVGGMTWCISICSYDVDVDLLFQENSSIGHKIALTEKIVATLKRMNCPHRIEPHQIQGLDFIHIYPVVQWLVRRAIETREETGDYIRAYSIAKFNSQFSLPEDVEFNTAKDRAIGTVATVKSTYRPERKYRRQNAEAILEEELRVQSTLLEYGRRYGWSKSSVEEDGLKKKASEKEEEERNREEEERCIQALMSAMALQEGKLTASTVGSLVGLQSAQIQQISAQYADKQVELNSMERGSSGVQYHQRQTTAVKRQIEQQSTRLREVELRHNELEAAYNDIKDKLRQLTELGDTYDEQLEQLSKAESEADKEILHTLQSLVAINESLKKQESEFRESCKQEMERLQSHLDELKKGGNIGLHDEEHVELIEQQYQANKEKYSKIRLLLARRNREIAVLQRKIDEVPSRAELSQYQRRFVELYNQVAAKHKETKQFYTLYNTLDDTKLYLNKEVNLLNSINDTFEQAMSSTNSKEQFLKQFEQIVEGVKQNRTKVERRKQDEKMKRDQQNDEFLEYVEKQRVYFKTVKDFQEECRRNEILLSKLQS